MIRKKLFIIFCFNLIIVFAFIIQVVLSDNNGTDSVNNVDNDVHLINNSELITSTSVPEKTTEKYDQLIPWIVFIVFIFIPMILIASILLLLLFITLFGNHQDSKKKSSLKSNEIVANLEFPIKLLPSIPNDHCFPNDESLIIQQHGNNNGLYYFLDINTTIKFLRTNQLYHPYSGLLFQLKRDVLYDPLKHCNICTETGSMEIPTINQVYSSFTNEIFERYQFMSYDPYNECFQLTDFHHIPRLPIESTPDNFVQIYQNLLNKSSSSIIKSNDNQNQIQMKNPLLLDRRDFTKPQTADFHQTPRSLLPIMANNLNKQDEKSQYASVLFKN